MKFHPTIQQVIKTTFVEGEEYALCPFCQSPMQPGSRITPTIYCDCSKHPTLQDPKVVPHQPEEHDPSQVEINATEEPIYSQLYYRLILSKKLFVEVAVDFQANTTHLAAIPDMDIRVTHTKFPFFNEMAMRHKLKKYLPFL
jgi:hypothetical protein